MAGKKETKSTPKARTKVMELPKKEKAMSKDELKKVKGGAGVAFFVDIAAKPKQ